MVFETLEFDKKDGGKIVVGENCKGVNMYVYVNLTPCIWGFGCGVRYLCS